MPLTIIKEPSTYVYSQDPITLVLAPSNVYTNNIEGVKMVIGIDLNNSNALAGQKLELVFNSQSITYTCVNDYVPTDEANTFPSKGNLSLQEWINPYLRNALASNYFFLKHFKLLASGDGILRIKCVDDTTNFTVITDITGATVSVLTQGILPSKPENYEVLCDLVSSALDGSVTDTIIASLSLKPSPIAPYHIQMYLEEFVDSPLYLSPLSIEEPQKLYTNHRFYYAQFTEKYGSPAQEKMTYVSSPFIGLKGSSDWIFMQQVNNYTLGDYLNSFLTNQPSPKKTNGSNPEFLYFFNKDYQDTLKVYVKVYWIGGSATTHTVWDVPAAPNQQWVIPCAWKDLKIVHPNFPKKVPYRYEVSLASWGFFGFNAHYTNIQVFDIDFCDKKALLFENSKGGIDTLQILDRPQLNIKSDKELLKRVWRKEPKASTAVYRKSSSKIFKAQTGMVDRSHMLWLEDLATAQNVWEYINGIYIPVIINTDSIQMSELQQDLYNISFDYQYAIDY
jgi:hypothetical protein